MAFLFLPLPIPSPLLAAGGPRAAEIAAPAGPREAPHGPDGDRTVPLPGGAGEHGEDPA